ncbi:MAG TPA: type II toxin-antitoxin system prevent-host-death family antitoxin [Planctomycetota bacterium]|nr:type II toxin-antitoxin system prevent-host-death family antitoxin [Planctomycetota bacterium]
MKTKRRKPGIVLRDGKPAAVILDIADYEEMLEQLEDAEDLRWLRKMRKKPRRTRDFEEVVAEIESV